MKKKMETYRGKCTFFFNYFDGGNDQEYCAIMNGRQFLNWPGIALPKSKLM